MATVFSIAADAANAISDVALNSCVLGIAGGRGALTGASSSTSVVRPSANPYPAVAVSTTHRFTDLPFDHAMTILDPCNWCRVSRMFRAMVPLSDSAPPRSSYLEVFSLDRSYAVERLTFRTCLDFLTTPTPSGGVLEYRLSDDQRADPDPAKWGDGEVTVDEGSIEVHQAGGSLEMRITKRVQFRRLVGMPGFVASLIAESFSVLGFSTVVEGFVQECCNRDGIGASHRGIVDGWRSGAALGMGASVRSTADAMLRVSSWLRRTTGLVEVDGGGSASESATVNAFTVRPSTARRRLLLSDQLVAGLAPDTIHPQDVSVRPAELEPGASRFQIRLENTSGLSGGTYWGRVQLNDPSDPTQREYVPIWLVVP